MASSSLTTLVQTKSIERVLAPIASQVSNLIILNEAGVQDQHAFPDLVSSAEHIFQTVQTLTNIGYNLAHESSDEQLSLDMPGACTQVLEAGNSLLTAAQQLRVDPHNRSVRLILVESAKKVLEYTVNVLLTSDDAEVRKIIHKTNVVLQKLWILENIQSWSEFRNHFQIFSDSVSQLLMLCQKRQNELVSPAKQDVIASSTALLANATSTLLPTSHEYMQNPDKQAVKARRDYIFRQIYMACSQIIRTVETKGVTDNLEEPTHLVSTNNAPQSEKPLEPASVSHMPTSGSDLDYYLDAIVRNSLAVAEKCENQKRKLRIAKACHEVLETRGQLNEAQDALASNPMSERYRQEFDFQTDKLQQCLRSLDRRVTMAIIAAVLTAFSDLDTPLQNLITAATTNDRLLNYSQSMNRLMQCQQTFLNYSAKICQAASNASSVAAEPDRVHAIRSTIGQIEALTPRIISTSNEIRQQPQNSKHLQYLKTIQQEWQTQVGVLSDLSVDAVSPGDFLGTTEALANESLTRCREALAEYNFQKLSGEISLLVGISERAVHVCKTELQRAADPLFKSRLTEVTSRMSSVFPELASLSREVICHIQDSRNHVKFMEQVMKLVESLGEMRSIVRRSPVHLKDNSFEDSDSNPPVPPMINVTSNTAAVSGFPSNELPSMRLPPAIHGESSSAGRNSPVAKSSPVGRNSPVGKNNPVGKISPIGRNSPAVVMNSPDSNILSVNQTSAGPIRNRNSKDIENYVQETRQCLLLGLTLVEADDIQMLGKLSALLRASPSSLMSRLLDAVSQSDYALVERRCNELSRRAASLKDFIQEPALKRSKNKEASSLVLTTSSEVYESTADVVQLAWTVAANPNDTKANNQLRVKCDKWSEKLDIVRATVDKLVNPWSVSASCVVQAATLKDQKLYTKQISNLKQHVLRLRGLASCAKAAADAEDAVDVSGEGEAPARNQDSLRRIELVMVTSAEMDELTKRFITVSQEMFKNRDKITDVVTLEFLRRDWACKVLSLILAVDDITAGTSAPVDGICTAALHGDHQVVRDRCKLLNTYIVTLKEMADGCSADCRDKEKADKAQETVLFVDELTQKFQNAVLIVQEKVRADAGTIEESLHFMSCVEKMVLLQREWSTKVHLFTSLIDDMTADVSAHVDRLAGAALNVSRVDRSMKLEYLRDFEAQSNKLSSKVARVRNHACLTISNSNNIQKAQVVRVTCDFLDRLTPQVIAAARGLADNPDQPTVEHFQMLRRQWASRAHFLMATLQSLRNVQDSSVEVVTKELLGSLDNSDQGSPPILQSTSHTLRDSSIHYHPPPSERSSGPPHVHQSPSERSYLHPGVHPITPKMKSSYEEDYKGAESLDRAFERPGRERVDDLEASFDLIDGLVTSLGDLAMRSQSNSRYQNHAGHSSCKQSTPSRHNYSRFKQANDHVAFKDAAGSKLSSSRDSLPRIASTESLDDNDLRRQTYSPAVIRRTVSFDGLNRSWRHGSEEDIRSKKAFVSIFRAAAQLRDEADKWEDENNDFVRVAKSLSHHMFTLAEMAKKRSRLKDNSAMIEMSKNIADDCQVIWEFATIIAEHCTDARSAQEILRSAESIPTLGTQLSIISSVKSATPQDKSADNILVRNSQNLMDAVVCTLRVIEGATVKGLNQPSRQDEGNVRATDVVFEWKRKLRRQRSLEALSAERGNLGLRVRDKRLSDPSLVDILHI
ncbi:uncharacterized protein LOC114535726 isoform X1 [Dendronephthya gigantea]|uniref:uncharacterized protein LOC114535726 isoform X1 n=1 Tax=Dendronephthya gigantea TaxID=151771 RepID=UPI00106C2E49|nr:uncharacterized protein LOC114535726 isoform X1 [Dendronephthya gigantea]XP_028412832.1 uncharacterized protein LOC114535726 isoform X1 [Dendronephthya gigantea]